MDADRVTGLLEYKKSLRGGLIATLAFTWSSILAYYWIDNSVLGVMFWVCAAFAFIVTFQRVQLMAKIDKEIEKELESHDGI